VTVTSGLDILPNVRADVCDGLTTFDVEYQFNRLVNTAKIDVETKSIGLELKGNPRNDDNTLTLMLPSALISGIYSISIDGQTTKTFTQKTEGDITILTIESILPHSKNITITGAHVIPEFSGIVIGVLIISLLGVILATKKNKSIKLR